MTMATERLKDLFASAIVLPAEAQQELLAALASEDPALASELASLLRAHTHAGAFLDAPARLAILKAVTTENMSIGPYRVVRLIAYGGMGEVYEATPERDRSAHRVALKVIRAGLASTEVLRRFEIERRTLARLDHPNIARLLDGGTTDDGAPYLAIEFIEGERIDEFCNRHSLSLEQRLGLFLRVCDAVQYAHGRLIVHRDLKPGNILVTQDGAPKLLDFGIAKLLGVAGDVTPRDHTRTGAAAYTPDYASPEQTAGGEVTTASDVYSLGVLLYVLLTGQRPFEITRTIAPGTSITSFVEPPQPSGREVRIVTAEGPDRVRKRLRGDLDTIILKALERNPGQRYISVEQFAEDLRRHLSHMPILARPAPAIRRITKFARRNRLLVGGVAVLLLGLTAGLLIALHQAQVAREEKARIEGLNTFLGNMLSYANPTRHLEGSVRTPIVMEDVLDEAAQRLESEEFIGQPELRIQLERILGDAYIHLGRYDKMYAHYRKCIQLRTEHPGSGYPDLLDTQSLCAIQLFAEGKLTESEDLFRRTLPAMRVAFERGELKAELFADALNNFGYVRRTQGDSHEAEVIFREVLTLSPSFAPGSRFIVSVSRATLASVLADQGKFNEAITTAHEAVEESHRNGLDSTTEQGFVLTVYGGFLTEAGRYAEAESTLVLAGMVLHRLLPPDNLWAADNIRNQAALCYGEHRYQKALTFADQAQSTYRKNFGTHYDNYPTVLSIKGLCLGKLGHTADAEKALREAVQLRRELMPRGHFFTALATGALGEFLTDQHRFSEAESLLLGSFTELSASQGTDNPRTVLARSRLRDLYTAWRKPEKAAQYR
jgi:eukaryotic-like serine/threonine-protein kinase